MTVGGLQKGQGGVEEDRQGCQETGEKGWQGCQAGQENWRQGCRQHCQASCQCTHLG